MFLIAERIDKEIGDPLGEDDAVFDVKTLDECAATHVVAAFDPRIDGKCLAKTSPVPNTINNIQRITERTWRMEISPKM